MISGWRARIHYWSRQGWLLKRLALGIVAASFIASLIIITLTPETGRLMTIDPLEHQIRQEWQRLHRSEEAQPYEMVRWLHQVTEEIQRLCEALDLKTTTWADYQADGRLAGHEVRTLLQQHATDPDLIPLWEDYIQSELSRDANLTQSIRETATQEAPPRTANLILAYQLMEGDPSKALGALMREATQFPESSFVREVTLHLAIQLEDVPVLRQIAEQPDWWSTMDPHLRRLAAGVLGDFWLQWRSLMEYRFLLEAPAGTLFVALLAASIWYIILVLHGVNGPWRWIAPLLPLLAGILSVAPVFLVASWQEIELGMAQDAPFPYDLWYQIGGVGMREELSKMFLASLFMPWLLTRRPAGGALMVGAFVGLGFALEENINYYLQYEGGIALTRFFTANFFHAAMTGITTHAFYALLRSRFATADRFLVTFIGVVCAHGCYNFASSTTLMDGGNYISMIILALTAWHFLDLVDQECTRSRQWVSPAAVFLIGTALIMAAIFLSVAIRTPNRSLLASAASSCVSMFPVAFIYWRRLGV